LDDDPNWRGPVRQRHEPEERMLFIKKLVPALLLASAVTACPDPFSAEEEAGRLEEEETEAYVQNVAPREVTVEVGDTRDVAISIAGNDPPSQVNVTTADAAVATATAQSGTSQTRTATISGLAVGQTTITFSLNGNNSTSNPAPSVQVAVVPPAVDLVIAPEQWQMNVGQTVQLECIVTLQRTGLPITGEPLAWSTSDATVATVDATGAVAGVGVGTALVTCTSRSGAVATAQITVTPLSVVPTLNQIPGNYSLTASKTTDTCPAGLFPSSITNPGNIVVERVGTGTNPAIAFNSTAQVIGIFEPLTGAYSGSGTTTFSIGQVNYQLVEIISGVFVLRTNLTTAQNEIAFNGTLAYEATPTGGTPCFAEFNATYILPVSF
jgi:hypothetical protein